MKIVLTGMRGVGKTTLAKAMAKKLSWQFLDMDKEIERKVGMPIRYFVEDKGWESFRDLEHQVAQEMSKLDEIVLATGGGAMIYERNAELLKENAVVVMLTCEIPELVRRIGECRNRPSLTGEKSHVEELEEVWRARKNKYLKVADVVYATDKWSWDAKMAKEIIQLIEEQI